MKYYVLITLCWLSVTLPAQTVYKPNRKYMEMGFLFGLTNYSGDLAEKRIHLSESKLGYGIYGRYFFSPSFALKAHAYYGSISGDDANAKTLEVQLRHFRFSTDILEAAVVGELHFGGKDRFTKTGLHNFFISPYLYLGLGGTFSGARAEYYGPPDLRDDYEVVPLPEEGLHQRFLLAPMGLGIRADINEAMVLGLELGWRPVFSDDLDGVKFNGNPNSNDWYYFGGITVSFILTRPKKRH